MCVCVCVRVCVCGRGGEGSSDKLNGFFVLPSSHNIWTPSCLSELSGCSERHGEKTALEMAAQKGHLHVARILIEYGADPDEVYGDGHTAHDLLPLGETFVSDMDRKLEILHRWETTPTPAPTRTPRGGVIDSLLGSAILHGEV